MNDPEKQVYFECLWCDEIRAVNGEPCPFCGRCAMCSEEFPASQQKCTCSLSRDKEFLARFKKNFGSTEAALERERQRRNIRKSTEIQKQFALGILCVVIAFVPLHMVLLDQDSQSFRRVFPIALIVWFAAVVIVECLFHDLEHRRLAKSTEGKSWRT